MQRYMNLNPIIPQRKKLHDVLWNFVQPSSTFQIELELEEQKFAYYNESCYDFPIEADTTPALFQVCQSVKERMHVTDNIVFLIDNRMYVNASCTASANKEYPSIITISKDAINTLTDSELACLIGHELGHVIMKDWLISFFFNKLYKKRATKFRLHQFHVLDLLSELEADRYGYLACGSNLDTFVSYQYKFTGGIDQQRFGVSTDTFLKANQRHMQKFLNGGWLGKCHPANALRIEAIRLFATCKTNCELQAQMKPIIDSIKNCDD